MTGAEVGFCKIGLLMFAAVLHVNTSTINLKGNGGKMEITAQVCIPGGQYLKYLAGIRKLRRRSDSTVQ